MGAPAVVRPAPRQLRTYGLEQEGTGAERKWCVVEVVLEGDKVASRKVIERTRWRDLAEDFARRKLWGKG